MTSERREKEGRDGIICNAVYAIGRGREGRRSEGNEGRG